MKHLSEDDILLLQELSQKTDIPYEELERLQRIGDITCVATESALYIKENPFEALKEGSVQIWII